MNNSSEISDFNTTEQYKTILSHTLEIKEIKADILVILSMLKSISTEFDNKNKQLPKPQSIDKTEEIQKKLDIVGNKLIKNKKETKTEPKVEIKEKLSKKSDLDNARLPNDISIIRTKSNRIVISNL